MSINKNIFLIFMFFIPVLFIYVQFVNTVQSNEKKLSTLILVPLDDRPANIFFPKQVGKSAGINVLMPPKEIIGYYTIPGDSQRIVDWLLDNADKGDGFILSSSMLAYGGLIASRTGERSLEEAMKEIDVIKTIKERYPNKPIYVYDTIQRLAVTALDEEHDAYYNQIREWAILSDMVDNFGHEEDKARLHELERLIPEVVKADYLKARKRNHEINKILIDWTANEYIDYLILAQDDAAKYGLHRVESEKLVRKVKDLNIDDKVSVFPGTDEVDVVLLARFATKLYNESPTIYVEYSGIHGKDWVAPFEDTTFEQNVIYHITASGAEITTSESNADINLILNTPSKAEENRAHDLTNAVDKINELINHQKPVAIGDVLIVNKADNDFISLLSNKVDITKLLSFSGWNTAGNGLGITIGHAVARDVFLKQKSGVSKSMYEDAAEGHYEFLLHRFINDVGYQNVVYTDAKHYINEINADPWMLGNDYEDVNRFVQEKLKCEIDTWFDHFNGRGVYIGSVGGNDLYSTIMELDYVHIKLPWPRIFEVEVEPSLVLE